MPVTVTDAGIDIPKFPRPKQELGLKYVTEFYNRCHSEDTGQFCETEEGVKWFGDYKMEFIKAESKADLHRIVAYYGDTKVGQLDWDAKEIAGIDVDDAHQRKGLATAMWKFGQEQRVKPKHSADRTTKGDLWAKAVGGKLPRKLKPLDPEQIFFEELSIQPTEHRANLLDRFNAAISDFHLQGQHDQAEHGNTGGAIKQEIPKPADQKVPKAKAIKPVKAIKPSKAAEAIKPIDKQ